MNKFCKNLRHYNLKTGKLSENKIVTWYEPLPYSKKWSVCNECKEQIELIHKDINFRRIEKSEQ